MTTVNIKHREQWNGKLPSRLMLCSNELPQLGDASMAIAGRFVPLLLKRSWYGNEDPTIEPYIVAHELPGVLNWALDGLERLAANGRFTTPPAAAETITTLKDLASPVAAFVRDHCDKGPDERILVDEIYERFREWADSNGAVKSSKQVFGRDLRAAMGGRQRRRDRRARQDDRQPSAGAALRARARRARRDPAENRHAARRPGAGRRVLNLNNWRRRTWAPAIEAAAIARPARIYDMRSTFASDALAAGVSVFTLAKIMGTSVHMIERHYGALLDGGVAGIADQLDALDTERDNTQQEGST